MVTGGCKRLRVLIATGGAGKGLYTGRFTTGRSSDHRLILMPQSCNLIGCIGIATVAGIGGVTLGSTGGGCHLGGMAVTGGGYGLNLGVATGDAGIGNRTSLGTGGVHCDGLIAVPKSCNFVGLVAMTAGTGVGGVTLVGTGRYSYLGGIMVSCGCQRLRVLIATGRASKGLYAGRFTTGRSSDHSLILMPQSSNLIGGIGIAAVADVGGITLRSTGRSRHLGGMAVTGGCSVVSLIAIATVITGVSSVTPGGTGGRSQLCGILMPGERDFFRVLITASTAGIGLDTFGCAGSSSGDLRGITVVCQLGPLQAINCTGLYLSGGGCSDRSCRPIAKVSPTLMGILLRIDGVILPVYIHGEPIGSIAAGRMRSIIAVIVGIAVIITGRNGIVIGMENIIGVGFIGPGGGSVV